ncbi:DUF4276 family protein [Blastopirellula marina]|uniref:DUF4276 domain-containing protein n=1 Tax=Blastopirellula marina TaxID=124 RepID=A0A2S8GDX2_9BACT|nr:DUF4276 family protein [Blastopirellula marina]PQO42657.1 hypothetical protein C5Y98_02120 [Blastopirellula marina]PTL46423.1 DUF4276 domain-containing protein [Blastopirellula marina]
MRIAILVEGKTETAFLPHLKRFLQTRLSGRMPKLDTMPCNGGLPKEGRLKRDVQKLLANRRQPADAVIALTDVYPEYQTAEDAKEKMKGWVGNEERFFVHVALHDFEAWLLPYWEKICRLTGSNRSSPGRNPEQVNHTNWPARRLAEVYRTGTKSKSYIKARDAGRILKDEDLLVAINACPELKAFINRILELCGVEQGELIP